MSAFGTISATASYTDKRRLEEVRQNTEEKNEAMRQAAAEVVKDFRAGQLIDNEGLFMSLLEISSDRADMTGKFYVLYAAPEDLTIKFYKDDLTGEKISLQVAGLRNWHGHNGGYFVNSGNVYDALKYGKYRNHINYISYIDQWFLPTIEFLGGRDFQGNKVFPNNLFDLRNTGDFKGTFITSRNNGADDRYMSSTKSHDPKSPREKYYVHFSDGSWGFGNEARSSPASINCRLAGQKL